MNVLKVGATVRLTLFVLAVSAAFAWADTPGRELAGATGIQETMAEIMERQETEAPPVGERPDHELEYPSRSGLPQNPLAPAVASIPEVDLTKAAVPGLKIHTTGGSFDGATLTDTGAFPPDSMGAVGPAQFITFVNGRVRSFTKAGVADGVINADPDVFFASVMTPVGGSVVVNFTSDPQVRYDRFTARWYLTIIDVPCTNVTCTTTAANRVLIAVSDAASAGTISGTTVWTFFQFQADPGTGFCDYPSLGIDVNALYVGCNMFTSAGSFVGTNGYVVRKSTTLGAGPITVTMFANLGTGALAGPFAPRGVDNFDAAATEGYFIGVDTLTFSTMMFRRVSNPGSATPTISANISVTVPTTTFPNPVTHLGNTGGNNGRLDSLDDRLFAAMIRNGRLWSAHNFRVNNTGVASTVAASRNATRWYEFQNLTTTPTVVQSGTVFDNAATLAAARQYFIPSVLVTGQGHAVLGFTMAGTPVGATPAYVGRLSGDTLGTMVGPPTTAAVAYGTTTANYNPPSDPGGASGRRWGDYSFTSLDPLDDMTVWTIQEYNQASNSYAVRVGRLAAPPPATPTCSGSPILFTGPTGNVVINATSSGGSGFYDPGANLAAPALAFSHISATVTNATVNSVTFNSPTQVTLNITASVAGLQDVTIVNPDGQSVLATGCINVQAAAVADLSITKTDGVATATPGGSVTYTITASNATATPATGATVADTFPAVLACTWTCVGAGGGTCTASGLGNINDTVNLPAGASVTYTATCAISASATGTLSNTATVTLAGDPTPANNSATDTDTLTPQADLAITKTDGVTTATPSGSVTYTITASNAGPSDAPGSSVADTFPASLTCTWTCVGAGGGTCTASGSGNVNDTVNLPSGGSVTYTASCTISASATGTLSNTSTVAAPGGVTDPTPGNNSATDSDTLTPQADLTLSKSDGGASVTPGGTVAYTLTYANVSATGATGVVITDTVPANTTFNAGASTAGWSCTPDINAGSTCTLTIGAVAGSSGPLTATFAVTVIDPVAAGVTEISNTASIADDGATGTDPTPGDNSASDTTPVNATPDLSISKSDGDASVAPGGTVTYTLTYANGGDQGATGVVITDTVPANTTFNAGASTAGWVCAPDNNAGSTCTLAIGAVAGNSGPLTATFAVTVINPVAAGVTQISNTASIADDGANGTDPTPGDNSASDTTPVNAAPDLSISKSDGGATVTAAGTVTYTLTYANGGNQGATGVVITDTVPTNTTFNAGASTAGWVCAPDNDAGSTCTLAIGAVPASSGPLTATFAVTVDDPLPGGVTLISNTSSIADDGANGTDPTADNNSDSDSTAVIDLPGTDYYTLSPCRVLDTRIGGSGGPLISGVARTFTVAGSCGIPVDAVAIAINLTAIGATGNGNVVLYAGDASAPLASIINFPPGINRANNAIVALASDASGTIGAKSFVAGGGGVDIVIDVVGYFLE